ncbi:YkgJ family cysteine cluster protein [Planctomicrobium sp. SH527]|uniref:YkgJ family cysteine cluster protein n=1 Tax=Planctomicrobium sp. SH527 TaxID=3448123 RepID=UPI003F5B39C7
MKKKLPALDSCDGCGACCHTVSAPPYQIDHVRNEPAEKGVPQALLLDILPAWEIRLLVDHSPCPWFDAANRQCQHYEIRPDACRDFEINSPSCHAVREQWLRP